MQIGDNLFEWENSSKVSVTRDALSTNRFPNITQMCLCGK